MTRFRALMTGLLIGLPTLVGLTDQASGGEPDADETKSLDAKAFLRTYCIACHSADDPAGGREFESLDFSRSDFDTQLLTQDVIDQLTLGTMPPEDDEQPETEERLAAIESLTQHLAAMRQASSTIQHLSSGTKVKLADQCPRPDMPTPNKTSRPSPNDW